MNLPAMAGGINRAKGRPDLGGQQADLLDAQAVIAPGDHQLLDR